MSGPELVVLGNGVMGSDIALSLALAGDAVVMWGRSEASLGRSRERMVRNADFVAAEGLATPTEADGAVARVEMTTNLQAAMAGATYVIEAVSEDAAL